MGKGKCRAFGLAGEADERSPARRGDETGPLDQRLELPVTPPIVTQDSLRGEALPLQPAEDGGVGLAAGPAAFSGWPRRPSPRSRTAVMGLSADRSAVRGAPPRKVAGAEPLCKAPGVVTSERMIDQLRRIYWELDRLVDAAGHGATSRIQLAAGLGGSFLRDQRGRLLAGRDKGYDLSALLRVLQALRIEPGVFFGKIFGSFGPIALTQLEAHGLGDPPEIVARVKDFLLFEEWQPLAEVPEHVRELDAHRYRNAVDAARFALTGLEEVVAGPRPPAWGIPLLAVYGSALRMTDDFDGAQQTLVTALELAEPTGDEATLGDLLQRLAYVVADRRGDYRRASQLSRRATDYHNLVEDSNSVGKTLVDRGLWLYKLGRPDQAIRMQHRALRRLEAGEHRHRFSALQVLGLCNRDLGDLENAHKHASQAAELAPLVGSLLTAKLLRLQAKIAVDRRQYEAAEEHLREAIEVFFPISAGEAALATTELVRVLLLQDRSTEAHEAAKTMAQFIIPLEEKSRVAASAALELLRRGQAGHGIPMELVDRVADVLEEERAHR